MAIQSIFTKAQFVHPWREASMKEIQKNPNDQRAVYVQLALNDVYKMHFQADDNLSSTLDKRNDIFQYVQEAANSGYAFAQFLQGICYIDGYGTPQDVETGDAYIRVAGVARKCPAALDYLSRRLGLAYLFGKDVTQSYEEGIKYLQRAGRIAQPELLMVAAHLRKMQARLQPLPQAQESNVVTLESAGRVRLTA
jgi:TPR repeat protein